MDIAAFKYSIQYVPQTTATIFAFSSSLSFFYDMYIVHSTLPLYCECAVDTTLCCVKQNKASIVFPASTRHFYCFNATFLLRQRDISTASTRHFYCVIATFLLRQCDIYTALMRHFYCVIATFLLRQCDISTASMRHFYCFNATFLLRQCDISTAST